MTALKDLPLQALHAELGAKFVPFAGWSMPVQYTAGVMAEHLWCREKAALFDVSHMCQFIAGPAALPALEALIPANLVDLPDGRQRYGVLTNDSGGIIDDLMIARRGDTVYLVTNAARRDAVLAQMAAHLTGPAAAIEITDRALLALQGPMAEAALAQLLPAAAQMRFMDSAAIDWQGVDLWLSRSGYTGEDGYEISVPLTQAEALARALLAQEAVAPAGLGARDSLRIEAGLPLYGQDLSEEITPVEAGLAWSIPKIRRAGGARALGYPGAMIIDQQLAEGAPRKRIGLRPEGRAPMRAGVPLFTAAEGGAPIGAVTSGGFGPSVGAPVALALVDAALPKEAMLYGEVRGKRLPAAQVEPPFVAPGYKR